MLQEIAAAIARQKGRAFYVGGCVRNLIMGLPPQPDDDIDIEVYNLSFDELQFVLAAFGTVRRVGKSFPILKISGHPEWDFAVPESPGMTFRQASARRDFTINSLLMDVLSSELIDPFGGTEDLSRGIIRHSNPETFKVDPVRVYRAFTFAARFNFDIAPETLHLITSANLEGIKPERLYIELRKLLMLSSNPSIGWRLMQNTGILENKHPMLFNLIGCPQSQRNHPEGDVWEHTLMVIDQAAQLRHIAPDPEALMWAALMHDVGKPASTRVLKNRVVSYGHHEAGAQIASSFLKELKAGKRITETVATLVKEHMEPILLYKKKAEVTDRMIRELVNRVDLGELLLLAKADYMGRDSIRDFTPVKEWLLDRLASLNLDLGSKIIPLVRGRDLQQMGVTPGPVFKVLLDQAWELQLEGLAKPAIMKYLHSASR